MRFFFRTKKNLGTVHLFSLKSARKNIGQDMFTKNEPKIRLQSDKQFREKVPKPHPKSPGWLTSPGQPLTVNITPKMP